MLPEQTPARLLSGETGLGPSADLMLDCATVAEYSCPQNSLFYELHFDKEPIPDMNKTTAHDDLAVVDRILHAADRTLHLPPLILVTWGLCAAIINGVHQGREMGFAVPPDASFHVALMMLAIGVTVWASDRHGAERETQVDSQAGITFGVALGVALLLNVTAQGTVIPARAMSLFWTGSFSIALLVVGIQASRPLMLGGVALLAASVIAGFVPLWFSGTLALGWLAGLVVPGVVLWSRRADV